MSSTKADNENDLFDKRISFVASLALIATMVKDIIETIPKLIGGANELSTQVYYGILIIYLIFIILAFFIVICFKKLDKIIKSDKTDKATGFMTVVSVVYIIIQNLLLEFVDIQSFIYFIVLVCEFIIGFIYLLVAKK